MNRTSEFRRAARRNHINRKKRIIKDQHNYWNYKFEGELDKGKIHCSCWLCSGKTSVHGWKPRDLREIQRCDYDIKHYNSDMNNEDGDMGVA